jgi:hypothetical protein
LSRRKRPEPSRFKGSSLFEYELNKTEATVGKDHNISQNVAEKKRDERGINYLRINKTMVHRYQGLCFARIDISITVLLRKLGKRNMMPPPFCIA